jgi:regulatory protein
MPSGDLKRAYLDGMKMLARRELSEAQVRERLSRRGHEPDAIDAAIARLRDEHAIDDRRVAEAIARTETSLHRRGKGRIRRQIEQAGIAAATARRASDEAFAGIDEDALIEAVLNRKLRGRDRVADDRELQRLYRYLLGQGFDSDRIARAFARRKWPG